MPGCTTAKPMDSAEVERRLGREIAFDPDLWIVEAEDRRAGEWLDLAPRG